MGKKRAQRKKDPQKEMALKKAKARREALWSYVLIAIVLGIILYGLYIQLLHHS
jgi:cell division septal protein FtsQ